jgi:hypothetical protein
MMSWWSQHRLKDIWVIYDRFWNELESLGSGRTQRSALLACQLGNFWVF